MRIRGTCFLFFYYPSDEYISYLMTVDELVFSDEIDCRDLFPGKIKESGLWCLRLDSYSADGNRFCFGRKCIIVIAEKRKMTGVSKDDQKSNRRRFVARRRNFCI